eukprot:m.224337 g.224337  ORF g.224337 m.224337 type:complete len:902 (-) comp16452_c0_seq1:194-2899(-)
MSQENNAAVALERLRTAAAAKHLRLEELFADFDRLRTGLVTRPQLERCVSSATNVILDNNTWDSLFALLPKRTDGMVAYNGFVELLRGGSERLLPQIGAELTPHLAAALQAIRNHCQIHGITIRSAFQDFDPLNRGVVTHSQFLRCVPVPTTFAPELKQLLADHYRRIDGNGTDYYQLLRDVEGYPEPGTSARPPTRGPGSTQVVLESTEPTGLDAGQLIDQLAAAFHRTRVRPLEYFRDFDRLRKGNVTESQFVSGLALACSAPGGLRLSHAAMQAVAKHFAAPGGFVRYRDFCHRTDSAFLTGREEDLVRVPTAEVAPLLRSQVLCETQPLVDEDEATLQSILERLRGVVEARRISVHPLLQDADKRLGFTKGVTAGQLRRVMDTLGLTLADTDMPFLLAKFGNPVTGHFNYHAFCAAIDPSTKFGQTEQLYTDTQALSLSHTQPLPRTPPAPAIDINDILDKLRVRVLERSLRPADVFADADPLRLGRIHRDRFNRAVGLLTTELTDVQLAALGDNFAVPPDQVDWRAFVKAIAEPSQSEGLLQTMRSTARERTRENKFDPALLAQFREAMTVAGAHMNERRFDLAGQLADPDRTRSSRITESQFVRVLSLAPLGLSPAQIRVIALYYLDNSGVDYPSFLRDVTPAAPLEDLFQSQTTRRLGTSRPRSQPSGEEVADPVQALLEKLHRKIVRERVGLRQVMKDFDKHAHGRITATEFQRCLSMAQLALSASELNTISSFYASAGHPGFVDYARFCSDVDASFATPSLERNPTLQATAFIPPADIEVAAQTRKVRLEEGAAADVLMARMASRVSKNRMVVLPPFKDFDRAVIGTVSKPQFLRVLLSLGLTDGATEAEVAALVRRYAVPAGGREDVHYRSYCTDLEAMAAEEHARAISLF